MGLLSRTVRQNLSLLDFMRSLKPIRRVIISVAVLTLVSVSAAIWIWTSESVILLRVPKGSRMPQAVIDASETVHLVAFRGAMSSGNLLYMKRERNDSAWSQPKRVNSRAHTVTGIGPIDGGQLALGDGTRLHIVWFRSDPVRIFYTRTTLDGTGFEPQRNLGSHDEQGVEAGPTVTADRAGNVHVFWHAGADEDARRAVYVATSRDNGATFEAAQRINQEVEGACACCGLSALSNGTGTVWVSYRGAGDNLRRGLRLLTSTDDGATFSDQLIHPWEVRACPVSTTTMSQGPNTIKVAWETEGQVHVADVDRLGTAFSPAGTARYRRKNPAVAVNRQGDTLLAWGDGPGLRAGGTLHWQVFDASGRPTQRQGSGNVTIPSGSLPTAVAQADGTFLLIF